MATSRELLVAVAPEFASESTGRLDTFLELAAQRLDATWWGDLYQQGAVYLAAHLLTLSARASAGVTGAGPIVSQRAHDLSVGFGAVVGVLSEDAKMATTSYGIEYLNLRAKLGPTAMVVG